MDYRQTRITKDQKKTITDYLLSEDVSKVLLKAHPRQRYKIFMHLVENNLGIKISPSFSRNILKTEIEKLTIGDSHFYTYVTPLPKIYAPDPPEKTGNDPDS